MSSNRKKIFYSRSQSKMKVSFFLMEHWDQKKRKLISKAFIFTGTWWRYLEEVQKFPEIAALPAVGLEQRVDGALEHGGVVDGHQPDSGDAVPAVLASPRLRLVHDVVLDEKGGLHHLEAEPDRSGAPLHLLSQLPVLLRQLHACQVGDEASVLLPT